MFSIDACFDKLSYIYGFIYIFIFFNSALLRFLIESSVWLSSEPDKYRLNHPFVYPNNSFCRNIHLHFPTRLRCPLQSAPVRTDGFFLPRNGCNIAPGTDPAPEAVTEDFRNFSQRFFAADFSPHLRRASCVFVRQTWVCPTKTLALRGRGRSRVATLF